MPGTTDRYQLTLLSAAQAHKEVSHNEALLRIDGLLHTAVVAAGAVTPPATPTAGEAWIVAANATGAWTQHSDEIALYQDGGWTFIAPQAGCMAWNRADGAHMVFDGTRWRGDAWPMRRVEIAGKTVVSARQAAITAPAGGAVVDTEARNVLGQLLGMLRAHGLIEA